MKKCTGFFSCNYPSNRASGTEPGTKWESGINIFNPKTAQWVGNAGIRNHSRKICPGIWDWTPLPLLLVRISFFAITHLVIEEQR